MSIRIIKVCAGDPTPKFEVPEVDGCCKMASTSGDSDLAQAKILAKAYGYYKIAASEAFLSNGFDLTDEAVLALTAQHQKKLS